MDHKNSGKEKAAYLSLRESGKPLSLFFHLLPFLYRLAQIPFSST